VASLGRILSWAATSVQKPNIFWPEIALLNHFLILLSSFFMQYQLLILLMGVALGYDALLPKTKIHKVVLAAIFGILQGRPLIVGISMGSKVFGRRLVYSVAVIGFVTLHVRKKSI